MKIKDRIIELRRVKAGELLPKLWEMLPCATRGNATHQRPAQSEVHRQSLVANALRMHRQNSLSRILCNDRLTIPFASICPSSGRSMTQVVGPSKVLQVAWAIVELVAVFMVYFVPQWTLTNKCISNEAMNQAAICLIAGMQTDDHIARIYYSLSNDPSWLHATTGSNATNAAKTTGFIHANKRRYCFPCFAHEPIV